MTERKGFAERWSEFRPSKALWLWSCVGCVVATMVVGFTVGGWVTGGTAQAMAESAAENTRAQIMASVCVERFISSDQFASQLASLKEADSWDRDDMIAEGGWLKLTGVDGPLGEAAEMCAQQLASMEVPEPTPKAATPPAGPATPGAPATDEAAGSTTSTEMAG